MRKTLIVFSLCFLSSCSLLGKKSDSDQAIEPDPKLVEKFNQGTKQLDQGNYQVAAKIFDEILVENPASEFDVIATFNSGSAYEGMNACIKAAQRYRQAIQASVGRFKKIEAQALLRLSYAHECMGDDKRAITTMLDLRRRAQFLDQEVVLAELPARLAAGYARMGNRAVADRYFKEASLGIQKLNVQYKNSNRRGEKLAGILYLMGRFNQGELQQLNNGLAFSKSLSFLQTYLLQAVEMGVKPWSQKSSEEILKGYDHLLRVYSLSKAEKSDDPAIEEAKKRELQKQIMQEGLLNLKRLKSLKVPGSGGAELEQLFKALNERERQFLAFMPELSVSTPMSDAAKAREGLKREGRTKGAVPELDKKAKPEGSNP